MKTQGQHAGLAGRFFTGSLETHWDRDSADYSNGWRGTWKGEQGGAILTHSIHIHDLLTSFLGPVARVQAALATRFDGSEAEFGRALLQREARAAKRDAPAAKKKKTTTKKKKPAVAKLPAAAVSIGACGGLPWLKLLCWNLLQRVAGGPASPVRIAGLVLRISVDSDLLRYHEDFISEAKLEVNRETDNK